MPIVGGDGGHGGGDALLLSDVFIGPGEDPLARPGELARRRAAPSPSASPATGRSRPALPVEVADLGIRLLAQPVTMSRIVVTGGAGRLGRSLVAGLAQRGHEVVSLDRVASDALSCRARRAGRAST